MSINRQRLSYFVLSLALLISLLTPTNTWAQEEPTSIDIDESFDPFTDYNEYEQQAEEEEDINFLKNGRYLTVALVTGYRGFLAGGFTEAYTGNLVLGAEFSYFFNMHIAVTASYLFGDHNVGFGTFTDINLTVPGPRFSGSVNIQNIDLMVKYYMNTDNVTKGLADLNPYVVFGSNYNMRKYSLDNVINEDPDKVWGFKVGGGIEIPILNRSGYLGIQGAYRHVQFQDENKRFIVVDDDGTQYPVKPRLDGDLFDITFLIGFVF